MPRQSNTEPEPQPQDDAPKIDETFGDEAAEMTRPATEGEQEETNVVRYIGVISERTISREDWEKAGVSDQEGVTWTKDSPSLPLDNFTEEALRVLSGTGEFQIVRDQ